MTQLLTTAEAAARLGLSTERITHLIWSKRLVAEKRGRDWLIDAESVEVYAATPRKRGRPKQ